MFAAPRDKLNGLFDLTGGSGDGRRLKFGRVCDVGSRFGDVINRTYDVTVCVDDVITTKTSQPRDYE